MSTIINSSDTASETRRTQGLKIISVILLTLFTGFYVNSWQRSLAEYAQKQQAETNVSSSTTTIRETSKVDDTQPVSTINRASEETVPVVTEVTMTVAETPTGAKLTDANTLEKLTSVLYNLIDTNWRKYPTFSENLVYRVTMNSTENVAEYQHINKAASKYIKETPLAKLANLSTTAPEGASKSTAEFLVILTPDGLLQVEQWVAE